MKRAKPQEIKSAIQSVIKMLMDGVMDKVLNKDPFIEEEHHAKKPLYAALVPDEVFKGSHFERRFVTPFGRAWEALAIVVAEKALGIGAENHSIEGTVKSERLRRISQVLNRLEHPERGRERFRPHWTEELKFVLAGGGKNIPVKVICDVYAEDRTNNKKYAFELKAPLPNSDQTKVSKEKILKLYCMEPKQVDGAYYALPYNPYGKKENYSWSFPARWFDMQRDEVVLIGNEFWDKIGGPGTYQSFIDAINEIGPEYKERIYREFLGIEPPAESVQAGVISSAEEIGATAAQAPEPEIKIVSRKEAEPFVTHLPVYSLEVAAGGYGRAKETEERGWVRVNGRKLAEGMFVAQVIGHSMEPKIPDRSYCLFRWHKGGTRQGQIILARHSGLVDSETGGKFTVKRYESEKVHNSDDTWHHSRIVLKPINPSYRPIEVTPSESEEVSIIAEFVGLLYEGNV